MAKKHPEINPSQGFLFEQPDTQKIVHATGFPSDPAEKLLGERTHPVVYGQPGSYVDLIDRADHLTNSLVALGKRNQRLGFGDASEMRPHSQRIWGEYGHETPQVQEGARRNVDKFLEEGKRELWKASGYSALRGSGLATDEEIDAGGRKMWRDFSTRYGDTHNRPRRDEYKKTLKATKRVAKKILKAAA